MSMNKCPWCGGNVIFDVIEYKRGNRQCGFDFEVKCKICKAQKPGRYTIVYEIETDGTLVCKRDDRGAAEKDWNTRYVGAD